MLKCVVLKLLVEHQNPAQTNVLAPANTSENTSLLTVPQHSWINVPTGKIVDFLRSGTQYVPKESTFLLQGCLPEAIHTQLLHCKPRKRAEAAPLTVFEDVFVWVTVHDHFTAAHQWRFVQAETASIAILLIDLGLHLY